MKWKWNVCLRSQKFMRRTTGGHEQKGIDCHVESVDTEDQKSSRTNTEANGRGALPVSIRSRTRRENNRGGLPASCRAKSWSVRKLLCDLPQGGIERLSRGIPSVRAGFDCGRTDTRRSREVATEIEVATATSKSIGMRYTNHASKRIRHESLAFLVVVGG